MTSLSLSLRQSFSIGKMVGLGAGGPQRVRRERGRREGEFISTRNAVSGQWDFLNQCLHAVAWSCGWSGVGNCLHW